MEYEIYFLCNLLGIFLIVVIILFHFVEADEKIKTLNTSEVNESDNSNTKNSSSNNVTQVN